MAVKTQGTQVYIIDNTSSGSPNLMVVECAVSIEGISGAREQIETTCLEDQARSYEAGLSTPGTAGITLNFDPQNESHVRLHELFVAGTKFDVAIGWSDGTAAPTMNTDFDFVFPTSRTFIQISDAYVADFPFSFAQNSVVTSAVSLQLSGFANVFPKV